jgi:hypothetical protein
MKKRFPKSTSSVFWRKLNPGFQWRTSVASMVSVIPRFTPGAASLAAWNALRWPRTKTTIPRIACSSYVSTTSRRMSRRRHASVHRRSTHPPPAMLAMLSANAIANVSRSTLAGPRSLVNCARADLFLVWSWTFNPSWRWACNLICMHNWRCSLVNDRLPGLVCLETAEYEKFSRLSSVTPWRCSWPYVVWMMKQRPFSVLQQPVNPNNAKKAVKWYALI